MRFYVPLIMAGVVIVFAFFMQISNYVSLSTNEAAILQPILYVSISVIIVLCIGILMIGKKFIAMKAEMNQLQSSESSRTVEKTTEPSTYVSADLNLLQTSLNNMEKMGKRTTYVILFASLIVAGVLSFHMYEHFYESDFFLTSGKFIIEDLNGQEVNAQVSWHATEGNEPFHVDIINSDLLPPEKIKVIKNAVLSEEAVEIPNSALKKSPAEVKTTYYKGWRGALMKASEESTSLNIPVNFQIMETNEQIDEISIILSKDRPHDIHSNTKSIVDADNHQILKSIITIYDVENLHDIELSAIIRHEFGHAIGLYPFGTKDKLTYHVYEPTYAYVSECNIEDIISLYNEQPNQHVCTDHY